MEEIREAERLAAKGGSAGGSGWRFTWCVDPALGFAAIGVVDNINLVLMVFVASCEREAAVNGIRLGTSCLCDGGETMLKLTVNALTK